MTISHRYETYLRRFGQTLPVGEFAARPYRSGLALRHDVDHDLDIALEMARFEYDRDIRASYFVLHSAPYWHDPHLLDKLLQLQDYNHEVGIHVNVLADWMNGATDDPGAHLAAFLAPLRAAGVRVTGMAAHGDQLCYSGGFINYWCFRELRTADPVTDQTGRTAEGPFALAGDRSIAYPAGDEIRRTDGARFPLWSVPMRELGLDYDAWHLPMDGYFSDSGGSWKRTPDPLSENLRNGRHQVLVHPIHWLGPPRTYFFLGPARTSSKWLTRFLNRATPVIARHEYVLNHEFHENRDVAKATGTGFAALAEDTQRATQLIADAWTRREEISRDYAEVNVYLETFVDILKNYFPDATFTMLRRDPRAVVRSLLSRGWYENPLDSGHRRVDVPDWSESGQFARVCHYVADTNRRLLAACPNHIRMESATKSLSKLTRTLEGIGIPVHPRLAAKVHTEVVDATARHSFPSFRGWSAGKAEIFERICGPLSRQLGYGRAGLLLRRLFGFLSRIRPPRPPAREEPVLPPPNILAQGAPLEAQAWHLSGFVLKTGTKRKAALLPDPARPNVHRHCVLGGSLWTSTQKIAPSRMSGWANVERTFLAGRIKAAVSKDGRLTVFALSFDGDGKLVHRRQLGVLSAANAELDFSCRIRADAARFDIALYAAKDTTPSRIEVRSVELRLESLARDYAALE